MHGHAVGEIFTIMVTQDTGSHGLCIDPEFREHFMDFRVQGNEVGFLWSGLDKFPTSEEETQQNDDSC